MKCLNAGDTLLLSLFSLRPHYIIIKLFPPILFLLDSRGKLWFCLLGRVVMCVNTHSHEERNFTPCLYFVLRSRKGRRQRYDVQGTWLLSWEILFWNPLRTWGRTEFSGLQLHWLLAKTFRDGGWGCVLSQEPSNCIFSWSIILEVYFYRKKNWFQEM